MESPSVLHLIAQAAEEQWEELDLSRMNLTELPRDWQLGAFEAVDIGQVG